MRLRNKKKKKLFVITKVIEKKYFRQDDTPSISKWYLLIDINTYIHTYIHTYTHTRTCKKKNTQILDYKIYIIKEINYNDKKF